MLVDDEPAAMRMLKWMPPVCKDQSSAGEAADFYGASGMILWSSLAWCFWISGFPLKAGSIGKIAFPEPALPAFEMDVPDDLEQIIRPARLRSVLK